MFPQSNVSPKIYKFSYEGSSILKDTTGYSESPMDNCRYISDKLYHKFQELKEELKEAVNKCPHAPCVDEDDACGYYMTEDCPFYWAFASGLIKGGEAL